MKTTYTVSWMMPYPPLCLRILYVEEPKRVDSTAPVRPVVWGLKAIQALQHEVLHRRLLAL